MIKQASFVSQVQRGYGIWVLIDRLFTICSITWSFTDSLKRNIPITQLIHISNQINQTTMKLLYYSILLFTFFGNAQQQPTLDYYLK
jgi:hypothetical protein